MFAIVFFVWICLDFFFFLREYFLMMVPVFFLLLNEYLIIFMDHNIKLLLQEIQDKDIRELVEDHIRNISLDESKKETIVLIDKRYVMNILHSAHYI